MSSVTILYYTSNREDPHFEEVIRQKLVEQNPGLPIISVSQKPIDLGKNICVGDVGCSYLNLNRQLQIGAREVETEFILMAESDVLYPPEYFTFTPEDNRAFYDYDNVYLFQQNHRHSLFHKKAMTEGARMVGRDFLLERLDTILEGYPQWREKRARNMQLPCEPHMNFTHMWSGVNPVITMKTGHGTSNGFNCIQGYPADDRLPYWGTPDDVRNLFK